MILILIVVFLGCLYLRGSRLSNKVDRDMDAILADGDELESMGIARTAFEGPLG